MFSFSLDGIRPEHLGILVVTRPDIPAPERNVEFTTIPGRSGSLKRDYGTYNDVTILIELNFMTSPDQWNDTFRAAKRWLIKGGERKLVFSDDTGFFRIVKNITINQGERATRRLGKFTAEFTCDPFNYEVGSDVFQTLPAEFYNDMNEAMPIYRITGEGMCTLTVNGNEMTANVGQGIIIDTRRQIAYKNDGTRQDAEISGDYSDLHIIEGDNSISITSGFTLEVAPYFCSI